MNIPAERTAPESDFYGHFVADDASTRSQFDRRLGQRLRSWHVPWDVAGITEPLGTIGEHARTAELHLVPRADGSLEVTLYYRLPAPPPRMSADQRVSAVASYLAQAADAL